MSGDVSSLEAAVRDHAPSEGVLGADMDAAQLDMLRGADGKLPANVFQLARQRQGEASGGPGRPKGSRNKRSDALAKYVTQKYGDPVESMAAIYAMPLDQLVETLLLADPSTREREDRLFDLAERFEAGLSQLIHGDNSRVVTTSDQIDELTKLADRIGDFAKSLKSKPGELALKALVARRDAARAVAEYVHGKMPVQVDLNTRADVILNIPGLTDPQALAEMVGQPELSDEDLARLEYTPFSDIEDGDFSGSNDGDGEAGDEG